MAWTTTLSVETTGDNHILDLNDAVRTAVADAGITTGLVCIHTPHTTAAVTALEFEAGANRDLGELLDRLIPREHAWHHNVMDSNGHAHARAAVIGPSLTLPVADGAPQLGTWQHVALIDFDDHPRTRQVIVTVLG